jgi:hypothetical protein
MVFHHKQARGCREKNSRCHRSQVNQRSAHKTAPSKKSIWPRAVLEKSILYTPIWLLEYVSAAATPKIPRNSPGSPRPEAVVIPTARPASPRSVPGIISTTAKITSPAPRGAILSFASKMRAGSLPGLKGNAALAALSRIPTSSNSRTVKARSKRVQSSDFWGNPGRSFWLKSPNVT